VLASGIRGNSAGLLIRAGKEGAGAATSKSCSLLPREGHANPTMVDTNGVYLNAIGLSNPGVDEEIGEIARAAKEAGIPIIASVYANTVPDFAEVARRLSAAKPHLMEIDISCPNVHREGAMFSSYAKDAGTVCEAVAGAIKIPFSAKLSPDVPNIGEIAVACIDGGASCITAVNTVGGMCIDAHARRAVLANGPGGISGPLLKPIALKAVHSVRAAVGEKIPIIGTGGVQSGLDAVEMLMAGATAVGVGTAVATRNDAFRAIAREMELFMKEEGYSRLSQLKLVE
jgi:dihydroorotate dehydrogenase (NAD+) catalytic subunit